MTGADALSTPSSRRPWSASVVKSETRMTGADALSTPSSRRPLSASVAKSGTRTTPRITPIRPSSASQVRSSSTAPFRGETHAEGSSHVQGPKFKVQPMSYFSVHIPQDELDGPTIDYTKDYRRYAYKDFALDEIQLGNPINPDALLSWVLKAKPRNQDDVYPIMHLCKGILKSLMEEKVRCRLENENAAHQKLADLQKKLDESSNLTAQMKEEARILRDKVEEARHEIKDFQARICSQNEIILSKESEIKEITNKLEDFKKKSIEMSKIVADLEKKLKSATMLADQRLRDYTRVNNSLTVRMQMTVKDTIVGWNLRERHQCLLILLHDNQPCLDMLQPADFQACSAEVRRDLTKKLLSAIKVCAASWLAAVSELFGCAPADFYDRVAGWYEAENLVTDEIRYHQQVEQFKAAIEGTDYGPIFAVLRQGVALGKLAVPDIVFECSGLSQEETMQSMAGMTLEEVATFKQRRKEILGFLQTRDSLAAREREDHARLRNLGFLHHSVAAADPMDVGPLCGLIARIFACKIAKDLEHADSGKKRLNIMKVTKGLLLETHSRHADVRLQIAKLVHGVRAHQARCPRARVFAILSGMDPAKPWFERASAFVMEFIASVVEGLFSDTAALADFRRRGGLTPMSLLPAGTDRIAWALADHDTKVPLLILLRAAMRTCEEHPCGYGYPRDRIQEIVDRASRPPPEYVESQRARIREGRERIEELHQNMAFERLYRPKGEQQGAAGADTVERGPARTLGHSESNVSDAASVMSVRPSRSKDSRTVSEAPSPPSPPEAVERAAKLSGDGETLAELAKSFRPDRRGGGKAQGTRQRRSSMVAFVEGQGGTGRSEATEVQHEFGVTFEPEWRGWLDVFCAELLLVWFDQHAVLEARMAHIFDAFDKDGSGTLELDEFKRLMDQTPMAGKYSEQQLLQMFSELTSQDGLLTKHDWTNLFHHVQFDVLTMIRPRRGSIRRMLVGDVAYAANLTGDMQTPETSGTGQKVRSGSECEADAFNATRSM